MTRLLICMADAGQDPTEVAVPFHIFKSAGFSVDFATEHGAVPAADPRMLETSLFGRFWGAAASARDAYQRMTDSPEFQRPLAWSKPDFDILTYDAILLPGGHAKPIRQYLESPTLHQLLLSYFPLTAHTARAPRKVVGAICHGVLALAFTQIPNESGPPGPSVLEGVESTTLPRWMEGAAWAGSQFWGLGDYYYTYGPEGRWCADDVPLAGAKYVCGPMNQSPFVHTDPAHRYISARFPGDAEAFANTMVEEIKAAAAEEV